MVELGPDLLILDVQADAEDLRGTYALQPSTDTWTRLHPRSLNEAVIDGPIAYLVLREGVSSGASPHSLVRTDGTLAGTTVLSDLTRRPIQSLLNGAQASLHDTPSALVYALRQAGLLTVYAQPKSGGPALQVRSFPDAPFSAASLGSTVVFSAFEPATGRELWATDGTPAGTIQLSAFGASVGQPTSLRHVRGQVLAIAQDRVVAIDPTSLAQQVILDASAEGFVVSGTSGGSGDLAYFNLFPTALATDAFPQGLHATDGTIAGTRFISSSLSRATLLGSDGTAAFISSEIDSGPEVWLSDGTAAGVRLPADAYPGPIGMQRPTHSGVAPFFGARLGDQLIYSGYDPIAGFELHAISVTAQGSYVAEPFGQACSGSAPQLSVAGALQLWTNVEIQVEGAAPLTPTRLFISAAPAEVPLGACTLYLASPLPIFDLPANAQGSASLPFQIGTNPAWIGLSLYLQGANLTPGGGFGGVADLTNAVELIFGQ